MDKIKRIDELVLKLNQAILVYEQGHDEIMTNAEYDKLYDELYHLEIETGYILKNSPTSKVGHEVVSGLPKVKHDKPMLSLDKTKDVGSLPKWLGNKPALLSCKLDGLTVVLTYNKGILIKAITRGNGEIGEDVTHNARVIGNIPKSISYKGELTIRGEVVISYITFNQINELLPPDQKYKNPRNLASGSIRQLDNRVSAKRGLEFITFEVVSGLEDLNLKYKHKTLEKLRDMGFSVVEHVQTNEQQIKADCEGFENIAHNYIFPVDGLVLTYNDIAYSNSLPTTSKFPKHSIALKWKDESVATTLRNIEWQTSRTGLINPVAIFDPIEIEGSTVGRASVHNLSIIENLHLHIGDEIGVIKANVIIPQISENYTKGDGKDIIEIPKQCPVCSGMTEIRQLKDSKTLHCTNEFCDAKILGRLVHFCKRDAMNIEGLSGATLSKLTSLGFVSCLEDIFTLKKHRNILIHLDGFGVKSIDKLLTNIENSKNVELPKLTYALGIENIGRTASKALSEYYKHDANRMFNPVLSELLLIDGIGQVASNGFLSYFTSEGGKNTINRLLYHINIIKPEIKGGSNQPLTGKSFVVTGKVEYFSNRKELQSRIEELGGKVVGSVSKDTNYLINNDIHSPSSKNKKALELNIPILTESDFIGIIGSKS